MSCDKLTLTSCQISVDSLLEEPFNLVQGDTISIRIQATNSANEYKQSHAQGYLDLTPGSPQNLKITASSNYFDLEWEAPEDVLESDI